MRVVHRSLTIERPQDPARALAMLEEVLSGAFPEGRVLRWAIHRIEGMTLHLECAVLV